VVADLSRSQALGTKRDKLAIKSTERKLHSRSTSPVQTTPQYEKLNVLTTLPTITIWKNDSSTTFYRRERLIRHIDDTLVQFHKSEQGSQAQLSLLSELYFSIDFWLKKADAKSSEVTQSRKSAVHALYVKVVTRLCEQIQNSMTPNNLPNWLDVTFGKGMEKHGYDIDINKGMARYLTPAERRKYLIKFKDGLAYQQQWWINSTNEIKVDTSENIGALARGKDMLPGHPGHQGFVLSMSRDLYMMQHITPMGNTRGEGQYHSSYFGGETILCAGTIKVSKGKVVAISTGSGHYRPGITHLYNAVATLVMLGVDVKDVVAIPVFQTPRKAIDVLKKERDTRSVDAHKQFDANLVVGEQMRIQKRAAMRATARREILEEEMWMNHFAQEGGIKHNRFRCEICKRASRLSSATVNKYWGLFLQSNRGE